MSRFTDMLAARWAVGAYVCVGLDPDLKKIPKFIEGETDAERVYNFLCLVINATHGHAAAYKPNSAFFEQLFEEGPATLRRVIAHIRATAPTVPIILDFKRGDIGKTNEAYVAVALDYAVEGITIYPYLGLEAMTPFLEANDTTCFVLCRTSNPGAGEFQDFVGTAYHDPRRNKVYSTPEEHMRECKIDMAEDSVVLNPVPMPLYRLVARRVAESWSERGSCGLVVGATYPEELGLVRQIVGDKLPLLIPGVGTQGGDIEQVVRNGRDSTGGGMVINSSSAILYAYLNATDSMGKPVQVIDNGGLYVATSKAVSQTNIDITTALKAV